MDDNNEIKIEIHNLNNIVLYDTVIATVVFIVWFSYLTVYFSVISLVLFILLLCSNIAFIYMYLRPTTIIADNEFLKSKHIFGCKTIKITDIKKITCEPYFLKSRYSAQQRMYLNILTIDGKEYEFNDGINTNKILNDKIEHKESNIPIVELYEFINNINPNLSS